MNKLASKIFIDGGVVSETREARDMLGYLDGQTTNPSLIAKNLSGRLGGQKLSEAQAIGQYKDTVGEISALIPLGSVSIQVFANGNTSAEDMLEQARERDKWITNASIKFPCTFAGLKAAERACVEMPINITLVFSQSQAAAVYEATKGAKYPVFLSPFVGRLDDRGENGMQVVKNILRMYGGGDLPAGRQVGHVEVLTASIRSVDHILYALQLKSQILTIPFAVFKEWGIGGFKTPPPDYQYPTGTLSPIPYQETVILGKPWQEYDLSHDLTDKGLDKFWSDWNNIVV